MTFNALACVAALLAGAAACAQWARARHLARLVAHYRTRLEREVVEDHRRSA